MPQRIWVLHDGQNLECLRRCSGNHSAKGTRRQEFYRYEHVQDFSKPCCTSRHALIPYLYSEFMKAAPENDMDFHLHFAFA
ncbi:MAG: TIM-barrel domain-containing protein [Blautia faecis]